ncbi:hypothetical protein [Asaccharospora irregularis]|uniref:N-6 DNA Methylase n=1 Tax=Asaccharospora irregularis DSM 2635 TaxID=1121321 RepID=A0A1M5K7L2_9FIRM|nr:hypothetical protein [Asaccharospora irregularis]SHG48661.1 hypothetical protein SAMN04488530_102155 [Asaccharospora irregularis DSM 2635]
MNYKKMTNKNNIGLLTNYEQIKSRERVNNHGEVLTPEWLVRDMLDLLPRGVSKIQSRYLETSAGEGIFLVEILRRKLDTVFRMYNKASDREFFTIVALCNIYGLELLKDNVEVIKIRLEMIVKDFFINKNNMTTSNIFFDIIKMILDINIINMDSMKFKEPVFDDDKQIMLNSNGGFIYKDELARISEWEFDYGNKKVKRIEYYYEDLVNKQKEEYLLKEQEKESVKKSDNIKLNEDCYIKKAKKYEQVSFLDNLNTNDEIKSNNKIKNIEKSILNPVRIFESVNYLKLLDLK